MPNLANVPADLPTAPDLEERGDGISFEFLQEKLKSQRWRLNNLYKVIDKDGRVVPFRMNWAQKEFYDRMWYGNNILKARQMGFSTFIEIILLDFALFRKNFNAVVIAHGKQEASILFQQKVLFAYNNLPDVLRLRIPAVQLSMTGIRFDNGSQIQVATSARSGTYQAVHISEFGKICVKYPMRADEIVSGTLPAIPKGGLLFVESTAEGQAGHFFDFCEKSRALALRGLKPTKKDSRFFFFPWHREKGYRLDEQETRRVVIPSRLSEYFYKLDRDYGIDLLDGQKAWYTQQEDTLGSLMRRENPSFAEEAFAAEVQGAYYARQIDQLRMEGRLCKVPIHDGIPVDTWWDLGYNDYCVIILVQTVGREIHIVDWYMNNGYGVDHYAQWLNKKREKRMLNYGVHYAPHDAGHHEIATGKTRKQIAAENGINWKVVPVEKSIMNGIDRLRTLFRVMWFDEEHCSDLLDMLGLYRKEWDSNLGAYKDKPLHDENSHAADAMRTGPRLHPMAARFNADLENGLQSVGSGGKSPNSFGAQRNRPRARTR